MTVLVDRITAVVAEHDDWFPNKHQTDWECACGWQGKSHAAHVAERVAEALQLTEETKPIIDPPVAGLVQSILGYERRWVSPWTTAKETS